MPRSWLRRLLSHQEKPTRRVGRPRTIRPRLEALEGRYLPSTVTSLNDSGDGSLRQAILDTPAGGTVDFDPSLSGTIALTSGELAITRDLTIAGPGPDVLTVSGSNASRVFHLSGQNTVAISGLTIADGRTTSDRGGGIYSTFGNALTITDCVLTGNAVASGAAFGGGAIESEGGSLTVVDSTLSGNSSTGGSGGGILSNSTLTVLDSTLSGNAANGDGFGGGLFILSGTATVTGSTFSGNTASSGGGLVNDNVGNLSLSDCTFNGNSAPVNSLGTGNGGAIYAEGGPLSLTSCTLSGNSAGHVGGGIAVFPGNSLSLGNTILAGNTALLAGFSPDLIVLSGGSINSQGYNLVGDGHGTGGFTATDQVGTANSPIDPRLGPLQDNGGPTQTMALLPGSPALNAGDPAQLGLADQRGVVRSGGVNVGAYQASASALVLSAPDTAQSGAPFDVTVTAVDVFGQVAVGYTGTVHFDTSDPGPGVMLPPDYTFTAADGGTHTFSGQVTLVTPGDQTLLVNDLTGGFGDSHTVTVQG
jgi:hypothetical protein